MRLSRIHTLGHRSSLLTFTFLQLLFAIGPGCSVKESRDECPCILSLIYDASSREMIAEGISVRIEMSGENGREVRDSFFRSEETTVFRTAVCRGTMKALSVWPGSTPLEDPGSGLWIRIPEGMQCPEIWTGLAVTDTERDEASADIKLRKNYCNIFMTLTGGGEGLEFVVRGNVCGYDCDGIPVHGPFSATAVAQEGSRSSYSVKVPRQADNSLKLDIFSSDGGLRTFAIGNYIDSSGYDWTSEDLKDINLEINYAATSVILLIDNWRTVIDFTTII